MPYRDREMATLYNGVDAKDGGKENATMYAMTAPPTV
jgi:hypothetical protein